MDKSKKKKIYEELKKFRGAIAEVVKAANVTRNTVYRVMVHGRKNDVVLVCAIDVLERRKKNETRLNERLNMIFQDEI